MADHLDGSSHRNGKDRKKKDKKNKGRRKFGLIEALTRQAGKDRDGARTFGSRFKQFVSGEERRKKKNNRSS